MNERLRIAYITAMAARHECSGTVMIHLGSAAIEYLKSLPYVVDVPGSLSSTVWGFPLVEADEHLGPDHISVHTVTTIA